MSAPAAGGLRRVFGAMASRCELHLAGADDAALHAAADAAIAEVQRIEAKYSRYRADSVVSRINAGAGGAPVGIDDETAALLAFADQLHTQSRGAFDITSGVLRRAWDFKRGEPPEAAAVQALLPLVGWSDVEHANGRVRLPRDGMEIDFGGFGKEYAADRAATAARAAGVRSGWIDLGGDLRVVGPRADGSPWQFGIQHPRDPSATLATVALREGALATSGDYERYFDHAGRRYCHVLDPRTGWPVTHWQSVSASAPLCVAAGALCTLAMLLGDDAIAFLDAQNASYLAVDAAGRVFASGLS